MAAVTPAPPAVARVCASGIAVFAALGILQRVLPEYRWMHVVDLDFEWAPPALFSATLLAAAAIAFWQLRLARAVPAAGLFLAVLFGFMAADEWFSVHETLERWTGVPWLKLYSPLILLAGVGWLLVLRVWWSQDRAAGLLLVGGAACWFGAQVLELLEWTGPHRSVMVPHYVLYMIPEELGEMTGSTLFLLSALVALKHLRAGDRA